MAVLLSYGVHLYGKQKYGLIGEKDKNDDGKWKGNQGKNVSPTRLFDTTNERRKVKSGTISKVVYAEDSENISHLTCDSFMERNVMGATIIYLSLIHI